LIVAVAVLATALVLVGVVVASAGSGGTSQVPSERTLRALRGTDAAQASRLRSDDQARVRLQLALTRESGALAAALTRLHASRAVARCWRAKASHPKRERAVHCGAIP
jgi:hypothetical protein